MLDDLLDDLLNVDSLFGTCSLLTDHSYIVLPVVAKTDITALQEMRWTGQGRTKLSSCDIYYSGHASRHEFSNLRNFVSRFTAVDERLAAIRIKAKYLYISLICAHAPSEDRDDTAKNAF